MPLFPTRSIYEDPDDRLPAFPEKIINVRPRTPQDDLLSVVFCIRSLCTQLSFEYARRTPVAHKRQPYDFAPPTDYLHPLFDRFAGQLWVDGVPNPPSTLWSVKDRINAGRITMCVVEATDHVPSGITALGVFEDIFEELARNASNLDPRLLIPVMIVDPQRSHSNGGRDLDGPGKLMKEARSRGIKLVETDIPNTQANFSRFLASLPDLPQYRQSLPSA